MPSKNQVTVSVATTTVLKRPMTRTERREAEFAAVATRQADLKRECAERTARREAAASSAD